MGIRMYLNIPNLMQNLPNSITYTYNIRSSIGGHDSNTPPLEGLAKQYDSFCTKGEHLFLGIQIHLQGVQFLKFQECNSLSS